MTYKVGAKGQVVLPKELRDELGIQPGDEVVFGRGDHEIVVRKARPRAEIVRSLHGALRDSRLDLVAELEAEHRREVEDDDRELRRDRP
jgi:AbrB family looped-hinge helix DNA binding protein